MSRRFPKAMAQAQSIWIPAGIKIFALRNFSNYSKTWQSKLIPCKQDTRFLRGSCKNSDRRRV